MAQRDQAQKHATIHAMQQLQGWVAMKSIMEHLALPALAERQPLVG